MSLHLGFRVWGSPDCSLIANALVHHDQLKVDPATKPLFWADGSMPEIAFKVYFGKRVRHLRLEYSECADFVSRSAVDCFFGTAITNRTVKRAPGYTSEVIRGCICEGKRCGINVVGDVSQ